MSGGPLVTVNEGVLEGLIKIDYAGGEFYSFQGIPYAKPPLGKLRFRAPQPPEKWEGIRNAQEEGNECYARSSLTLNNSKEFVGSEDCLYLNVFTKNIRCSNLKPVMVWIHGGGFTTGSSTSIIYGPEYLITHDIVLVTLNYRLGALGFLSLEDSSLGVTGNAGLKDIVMVLKWVQKNIKEFCGDPNNVTIFGESAGGAAVHFLMLSPITKGLFHKAIIQSGSALNMWANGSKYTVYSLARILGIESDNDGVILEHLQNLSIEELFNGIKKIYDPLKCGEIRPFCPIVERKSAHAFLTETPLEIIKSGKYHKVPLIIGNCSREGMYIYGLYALEKKDVILTDDTVVPYTMNWRRGSQRQKAIADIIREFYYTQGDPLKDLDLIYKLYTDIVFLLGIYNAAKYHLETSSTPIYYYRFLLDTHINIMKSLYSIEGPGACHADDLAYLFKNVTSYVEPDSPEEIGIKRVTKLWTNFAKFGNPTPDKNDKLLSVDWKPATLDTFNCLDIGESLEMKTDPEKQSMEFWNKLIRENTFMFSKL